MSWRRTTATALRVLSQLRRDHRTLVLLLLLPCVLLALLAWVFDARPEAFDRIGAPLLGVFPFLTMFLVTSVATLRERSSGTLERLLAMPLGKLDLLLGYALAFGGVAVVQAAAACAVATGLLGLDVAGPVWALAAVAVLDGLLGMALGLFVSAFARTEFQAVQFMPAVVLPQLLLCGLLAPRADMARGLELVSAALPLTYAVDALQRVAASADLTGDLAADAAVVAGCTVAALGLGAATLRRRTP